MKKTLARDGPTGLYRGVVPPLLGVTPIFALSFWVLFPQAMCSLRSLTPPQAYDASKRLIRALTPSRTDSALSTGELASAGFMSAVPTTLVTAPVERAKVLLQVSYHSCRHQHAILILCQGTRTRGSWSTVQRCFRRNWTPIQRGRGS